MNGNMDVSSSYDKIVRLFDWWLDGRDVVVSNDGDNYGREYYALVDGIITDGDFIAGVYEFRTRSKTYEELLEFGTLMIEEQKLKTGKKMSYILKVPYFLFIHTADDFRLVFKIANNGKYLIPEDRKRMKLTRTMHDKNDFKFRDVLFIPLELAEVYDPYE